MGIFVVVVDLSVYDSKILILNSLFTKIQICFPIFHSRFSSLTLIATQRTC